MATRMSPKAEMMGVLVLASLNTMRKEELGPLLDEAKTYKPDQWYSVAHVRKMLENVVEWRKSLDSMFDLVSLGAAVTQTVPLPPEWVMLEDALQNYGTYHQKLYRKTGLDWLIKAEAVGEYCFRVRFRINFPDHFLYGWLFGFAKRFLPAGTNFSVLFDDTVVRADAGGDETVIWVKWDKPSA